MNTATKEKKVQKRIKAKRSQMNMSQEELARRSGLDRKTVNRIERGHYSPSLESLFMLCSALKIKPSDILDGI